MISDVWHSVSTSLATAQADVFAFLADQVSRLATGDAAAIATIAVASLAYGVVHAAGPGHGKALIAAYLGASRANLRRGVALSVTGSMLQAIWAITIVGVLAIVLDLSSRTVIAQALWIERASAVLTAALGCYLIVSAVLRLLRWRRIAAAALDTAPDSHFCTAPGCGHLAPPSRRRFVADDPLAAPPRLETVSILLSMASRPCGGTIFVLLLGLSQGLFLVGVLAALAIGVGTALTVVLTALLTVALRDRSLVLAGNGSAAVWLGGALSVAGGLVLVAFGAALLTAPQSPFGPMLSG